MPRNGTPPKRMIVDQIHLHVYSNDGSQVDCEGQHDIPEEIKRQGVRAALWWAIGLCPTIRAARDAQQRRN